MNRRLQAECESQSTHRPWVWPIVLVAAALVLPAGALSGLPGLAQASEVSQAPVTVTYGMLQEIDTLNPIATLEDSGYFAYSLVYDTLVRAGPDLETLPGLADDWDFLDNDLRWRLYLNTTAKWHNGQDFDADDVEYSINLNLHAQVWSFDPLIDKIASVSVVDSDTIDIYLNFPSRVVIDLLFPILPKHLWDGIAATQIQYTYPNSNPIGTGVFKFVSWSRGQPWIGERNPDYFLGPAKIDRFVIVSYTDPNAMALDLTSGRITAAELDSARWDALAGEPNIERLAAPTTFWLDVGWALNAAAPGKGEPGIKDLAVRQALRIATDTEYINRTIYKGHADRGSTLISHWVPYWHYEPNQTEMYFYRWTDTSRAPTWAERLQLANGTLDTAGWVWNPGEGADDPRHKQFGGKTEYLDYVMLVRSGFPDEELAAKLMQAWWAKIGFVFSIFIVDEATMEDQVYGANEDLYIWYWSAYVDPTYQLGVQICDQAGLWGDNFWCGTTLTQDSPGYDDRYVSGTQAYDDTFSKKYDDLYYLQQTLSADPARRKVVVDEMSRLHYFDQAFNIYAYPYDLYAWRTDKVTGWNMNTLGRNPGNIFDNQMWRDLTPVGGPVNEPPTVIPGPDVTAFVNDTVEFIAIADDPEQQPLTFTWTFGDVSDPVVLTVSAPATGLYESRVNHMYNMTGTYTVVVTVTDGVSFVSDSRIANVLARPSNLGWVVGTVLASPAMTALSGATVQLSPGGYADITDPNGQFNITAPAGSYTANASREFYQAQSLSVTVVAGQESELNFVLAQLAGTLRGVVKSAETDAALVGASVKVWSSAGALSGSRVTNATGYILTLAAGTYRANASFAGYISQNVSVTITVGATLWQNFSLSLVPEEGGIGTLAIVSGAIVVIAVAAIVAYLFLRRRRGAEGAPPEGGAPPL